MKVITATMAKNISNDFANHANGHFIKRVMDEILLKAEQGKHEVAVMLPKDWDSATINNVAMFFCGLGYNVITDAIKIVISW